MHATRPVLVALLLLALSLGGCSSPKVAIPPGQDADQLAESIARRGSGEEAVPVQPDSDHLTSGDLIKYSFLGIGYAAAGTFYLGLLILEGIAKSGRL